ncbi:MAG: membrane-bound lytic murein transglycosylase MltF [Acidiferrobacterales bacterium]
MACSKPPANGLEAVKAAGKLVVVTRNAPTTYYEGPEGPAGIEYDMLKGLAKSLRVDLEMVVPERLSDILPMVVRNEAHMAAAGLSITDARKKLVRFAPPYQQIQQQVVYRLGTEPPKSVEDLIGRQLEVVRSSSYAERLAMLKRDYPELTWTEVEDQSTEDLLQLVWEGLLELTIADSNIFAVTRQYYPELRVAFSLDEPRELAWAFPASSDHSLYNLAVRHINRLRKTGELAYLIERYYGPTSRFNYINLTVYQRRVQNRLPTYQALFEQAGERNDIDWRLLAAVGYQESYWDPRAVSPTGVRGIMMLTRRTAKQLGIADRVDPSQSIEGGSRYIRSLIDRMPKRIAGPDRLWMALAAYNVGIHHLEDARIITQKRGRDPNKWNDVKDALPLLSKPAWYKKTKHGYARGVEPVRFVSRVRTYYDVLVKIDEEQNPPRDTEVLKIQAPAI